MADTGELRERLIRLRDDLRGIKSRAELDTLAEAVNELTRLEALESGERVTPEMIEAGARGRYEYQRERLPDVAQPHWEELPPAVHSAYRNEAESVLSAALPDNQGAER